MKVSAPGQFDMPSFRGPDGIVYVWDPTSGTMVPKPDHEVRPDIGHATGGDNDLFDPFTHTEQSGVPELEGHMSSEWAPPGKVNCPNCQTTTEDHICPTCGKDLTPEWNHSDDKNSEFQDVHVPYDWRNEFISDPERTPKTNWDKTDNSFPSMNLSHTAPVSSVKPYRFSSFAEELAWHEANDKNLEDCPECGDVMHDQDGEKVCHGCGHKQKIITAGAAAALAPEALGLMGGEAGGGLAGGLMGGGGMGSVPGLAGVGELMNKALGGGQNDPNAAAGSAPSVPPGVISHKEAGLLGDIVEGIVNAFKQIPNAATDPTNPLSYADDAAAALVPHMPQGAQQAYAKADDTFGEDEVGLAAKNDGTNSDPEEASNSGTEGKKEHGDGPEQLKDTDGIGGPTSPDEAGQLDLEGGADLGDPHLQDKAMKAFHMNKPLVIEFAESPESGSQNPILLALDQILEEAFPGYRGGTGDGTSEHPQEGNNEAPSEDESGEKPDEGDSKDDDKEKKESSTKTGSSSNSLWHFADAEEGTWRAGEDESGEDEELEHEVEHEEKEAEKESEHEEHEEEHEKKEGHVKTADAGSSAIRQGLIQPTQWGSNSYPGDSFAAGAPGVAGAPQPCAQCGNMHQPGTPCPVDSQQNVPQPLSNGAPISPQQQPNVVTTKWRMLSSYEVVAYGGADAVATGAPPCPACGGQGTPIGLVNGQMQYRCMNCGNNYSLGGTQGSGEIQNPAAAGPAQLSGPTPSLVHGSLSSVDDEFGFFAPITADDHAKHNHGGDWMDVQGAPLQAGHDYDLLAQDYAIPDKITVNAVYPDKISYTMHPSSTDASSLPYHAELTKQEFQTMSYQFVPSEHADNIEPNDMGEHPVRPGQDSGAQVDDLSTPSTVVSRTKYDPDGTYTGSFRGDPVADRSWVMESGSSDVMVDPTLMAKFAGKDFSGQEQRAFIDEEGTARNLGDLQLEGTHYLDTDVDDSFAFGW